VVLAAVSVLFLPGGAVLLALGRRGLELASLAPPVSLGIAALSAVLAGATGIPWTPLVPFVFTLILVAVAGRGLPRSYQQLAPPATAADGRAVAVGIAVAAALVLPRVAWIIGRPDNIAQSHDNMFHLNAVRFVLTSGNGSPFDLAGLGGLPRAGFYPAAWHDVVALVCQLGGVQIEAGINATSLVLAGLVWPLALMSLSWAVTRTLTGLLAGAAIAAAFATFPYLMLEFGVVYPFFTSLAVLPAILALLVRFTDSGAAHERHALAAAGAACVPGVALCHPSVLVIGLLLAVPLWTRKWTPRRIHRLAGFALWALVTVAAWIWLRPVRVPNWDGFGDARTALSDALLLAPFGRPVPWALVLLLVCGVLISVLGDRRWPIGMFGLGLGMYVVTQLQSHPEIRWWLSGVWYSDPFRQAAVLPLTATPLLVLAASTVAARLGGWTRFRAAPRAIRLALTVGLVVASLSILQSPSVSIAVREAHAKYEFSVHSALLSTDERQLLERLPQHVPEETAVVGDPLTGAGLTYAFAERRTLEPYPGALVGGRDTRTVLEHLDELRTRPSVCDAVRRLRLGYVVDFGHQSVDPGVTSTIPGLDNLSPATGFHVVDHVGTARLWAVAGCGAAPR
jgi:hypothetical protein